MPPRERGEDDLDDLAGGVKAEDAARTIG